MKAHRLIELLSAVDPDTQVLFLHGDSLRDIVPWKDSRDMRVYICTSRVEFNQYPDLTRLLLNDCWPLEDWVADKLRRSTDEL